MHKTTAIAACSLGPLLGGPLLGWLLYASAPPERSNSIAAVALPLLGLTVGVVLATLWTTRLLMTPATQSDSV